MSAVTTIFGNYDIFQDRMGRELYFVRLMKNNQLLCWNVTQNTGGICDATLIGLGPEKVGVDILKTIAKQKGRRGRVLVGFALETDNLVENAKKKLKEKDLDLIVANDHSTFDNETVEFAIIGRDGKNTRFPEQPKDQAAHAILDRVKDLI